MLTLIAQASCPGSANLPKRDGHAGDAFFNPLPDGKGWVNPDSGQQAEGGGGADLKLTETVGGACPCKAPLLCVLSACRKPCNQVICNGKTDCDPGQACINTKINTPVCVPGVATGAQCSETAFCESGNLCLATAQGAKTGTCFATCAGDGATCAGGTCSALGSGSTCFFCQPK